MLMSIILVVCSLWVPISGQFQWGLHDISGRVTFDDLHPFRGVTVQLKGLSNGSIRTTTTRRDGSYFFDCVEPGEYDLIFEGQSTFPSTVRLEFEYPNHLTINQVMNLNLGHYARVPLFTRVTIQVVDGRTDQPITQARITVGERQSPKFTDNCGRLSIPFEDEGTKSFVVEKDGYLTARRMVGVAGKDVYLRIPLEPDR